MKYLKRYNESVYDNNGAILKRTGEVFWMAAVELGEGNILEVHTFEEAQKADFHTCFYFSVATEDAYEKGTVAYVWFNAGVEDLEWALKDDGDITPEIIEKIEEQIEYVPEHLRRSGNVGFWDFAKESAQMTDIKELKKGIKNHIYNVYQHSNSPIDDECCYIDYIRKDDSQLMSDFTNPNGTCIDRLSKIFKSFPTEMIRIAVNEIYEEAKEKIIKTIEEDPNVYYNIPWHLDTIDKYIEIPDWIKRGKNANLWDMKAERFEFLHRRNYFYNKWKENVKNIKNNKYVGVISDVDEVKVNNYVFEYLRKKGYETVYAEYEKMIKYKVHYYNMDNDLNGFILHTYLNTDYAFNTDLWYKNILKNAKVEDWLTKVENSTTGGFEIERRINELILTYLEDIIDDIFMNEMDKLIETEPSLYNQIMNFSFIKSYTTRFEHLKTLLKNKYPDFSRTSAAGLWNLEK